MHYHQGSDPAYYLPPQVSAPPIRPDSFVVCPFALVQGMGAVQRACQAIIYQMAFEQAQATIRPSLPERDLLAVWN